MSIMLKTTLLLLLAQSYLIFSLSKATNVSAHKCLEDSNDFYCKLSSKTPYRFIANYNDSQLNYPGCTEKKIWLTIRHGTRFPGKKDTKLMIKKLPELQNKIIKTHTEGYSNLPPELIERLTKWRLTFDDSSIMVLTEEGENELTDLAERMQARFPSILLDDYSEEIYKFKYTATQRTESSAKSFARGLFGQHHSANISFPEPEDKDPILRFYKRCKKWKAEVDKNPQAYKERDTFIKSAIFQKALSNISERIGFQLDYETANLIYATCSFETAWYESVQSPWCDLLSYNDLEVLEFAEDLEYYWIDGYGYRLNYEQACPALRDMFTFFDSNGTNLATAYFTHSGTILKLLSSLGVAKDDHSLTHDSFLMYKNSRNWKVSLIDSFASNIAFVLYDCETQGPSVLLLHQERSVQIPGCPIGTLCPMTRMKEIFPDTEQECQFDAMCSLKSN